MRRSRAVCLSTWTRPNRAGHSGFWKSPYEGGLGPRFRPCRRAKRLETASRINGSHHIYGKQGSVVRLSIPIHGNQALKSGLLRHLMKLAGLSEAEFG